MIFNSFVFAVFAAVLFSAYFVHFPWRWKKVFLLLMSYIFYGAWNAPYLLLIVFSTILDFFVAHGMVRTNNRHRKSGLLLVSLLGNLGVLSYFKYGEFAVENFAIFLAKFGVIYEPAPWSILLPVGISFYTFQTLSYTIDVYKGRMKPSRSFLDFALFVVFFPQLVAGPIVRARKFMPQLLSQPKVTLSSFSWGISLAVVGLFEKVAIADGLMAPLVDKVFAATTTIQPEAVIFAMAAFFVQLFCDFSGYSLIAIGLATSLGFHLPVNFRAPLAAIGFRDLWQRWHISMSTWFRDYLYAAIRPKKNRRLVYVLLAQFTTMTVIGLWHGAGWNFIVWGAMHGVFLCTEIFLKHFIGAWQIWKPQIVRFSFGVFTAFVGAASTLLFRSENLGQSVDLFASFFVPAQTHVTIHKSEAALVALIYLSVVGIHIATRHRKFEDLAAMTNMPIRVAVLASMMVMVALTAAGTSDAFIYFQF